VRPPRKVGARIVFFTGKPAAPHPPPFSLFEQPPSRPSYDRWQ
jgi:hypothetical protein